MGHQSQSVESGLDNIVLKKRSRLHLINIDDALDTCLETRRILLDLQAIAAEDVLVHGRLTAKDLKKSCHDTRKNTARGVDDFTPMELASLPDDAWNDFADLVHCIETKASLPWQTLLILVALIPKSLDKERAIAKCPMIYRLIMKSRRILAHQ